MKNINRDGEAGWFPKQLFLWCIMNHYLSYFKENFIQKIGNKKGEYSC